MFTLLVILILIAVALIYLLQYQIVRDYQPIAYDWREFGYDNPVIMCRLVRYSIFDINQIL